MQMWSLGRLVVDSNELMAMFDAGYTGLDARLRASDSEAAMGFVAAFDSFLFLVRLPRSKRMGGAFSHLGDRAGSCTGGHRSDALVRHIRCAPTPQRRPTPPNENRSAPRSPRWSRGDPETHGQFLAALNSATVFMPGRERTKTNNIKLVHELRVALHEIGHRRVRAGTFHKHDDFGLLTRPELKNEVANPGTYTDQLADREALLDEVASLQEPFLFHGGRPDMAAYPAPRRC